MKYKPTLEDVDMVLAASNVLNKERDSDSSKEEVVLASEVIETELGDWSIDADWI